MKRLRDIREALEIGTDKIVDEYKKATPGEDVVDPADKGEYDNEGEMAKTQLRGIVADASHMIQMFSDEQNLPEWVQNKITKSADYLNSAHRYMMNKESVEWVCGQCNCDPCTCEGDIHESLTDLQELDAQTQKKFSMGAKNMKAYAQKNGGVDKKDFMDVAKLLDQIARVNLLQAGQLLSRLNRLVDGMDTDVRERIYVELKKVGLVEEKQIDEEIDLAMHRKAVAYHTKKAKPVGGRWPKNAEAHDNAAKAHQHVLNMFGKFGGKHSGTISAIKVAKKTSSKIKESLDEKAPKIDDKKYAAHMARNKKPAKQSSTKKSLSDISKRANEEVDERKLTPKEIKKALASTKAKAKPKSQVSLKKAPFEIPESLQEKLTVADGMAQWIKDFQASDAPQFKGKDKDERKEMAIAAYLAAKREAKKED